MENRRSRKIVLILLVMGTAIFFSARDCHAVPSFARQIGLTCNSCHTIYPELTPYGRHFKIMGYAMSKSDKPYEFPPPVTAVAKVSFTRTDRAQPKGSVEDTWANVLNTTQNNFFYIPQVLGLYYAGKIYYKFGALIQGNYDGVGNDFALDITDIRFGNMIFGNKLMFGATIDNLPTLGDPWNSTPAWGFPYETSPVAPTPAASAVIDGALANQVGGVNLFVYLYKTLYLQAGAYRTAKSGITNILGAGTPTTTVVSDAAPYWRIALQRQWGKHSAEIGTYGLWTKIFPAGFSHGATDRFTDIALDGQYQYISKRHVFSVQTTWIYESQHWNASFPMGSTGRDSSHLNTFKINTNYYYRGRFGTLGGTLSYFLTTGNKDAVLYAPDSVDGSRSGSPDSDGFIVELDYLPFGGRLQSFSPKVTAQYVIYNKFNGARSNYDGFDRDASDNNTFFLLIRMMF
jgi:hypothetical protein